MLSRRWRRRRRQIVGLLDAGRRGLLPNATSSAALDAAHRSSNAWPRSPGLVAWTVEARRPSQGASSTAVWLRDRGGARRLDSLAGLVGLTASVPRRRGSPTDVMPRGRLTAHACNWRRPPTPPRTCWAASVPVFLLVGHTGRAADLRQPRRPRRAGRRASRAATRGPGATGLRRPCARWPDLRRPAPRRGAGRVTRWWRTPGGRTDRWCSATSRTDLVVGGADHAAPGVSAGPAVTAAGSPPGVRDGPFLAVAGASAVLSRAPAWR